MCPKKVASTGLSLVPVAIRVCWHKPSKVPTYPIFCVVKATILGHILAPFGGGLGGFYGGLRRFFLSSWAS